MILVGRVGAFLVAVAVTVAVSDRFNHPQGAVGLFGRRKRREERGRKDMRRIVIASIKKEYPKTMNHEQ